MSTETSTTRERGPSLFRLKGWGGVLIGVFVVLIIAIVAFATIQPIKVLPRIRLAPGFALTDQNGQRITNEDQRGQFTLYNFTYTECQPPACAQTDDIMREVQNRLGETDTAGIPISLVTLTVDPDHDTPDALRAYAGRLGADPTRWRFLTGEANALKNVIGGGFEVYYQREANGVITLSPTMVLVDDWGIIRAVYSTRTGRADTDRILRHLNVLGQEARNRDGIARLGYEAAHLFLCYAS